MSFFRNFIYNDTCGIQNESHLITSALVLSAFIVSTLYHPTHEVVKLKMGQQSIKKMSIKFGVKSSSTIQSEKDKPILTQSIKKENTIKKVAAKAKSHIKKQDSDISALNAIFDKVDIVNNPADMVPHYDQIDYTKNAKELGFVMENSQVQLPKLQGQTEEDIDIKKNNENSKEETPILNNKELEAVANMLYNSLRDIPNETLPDIPADWVKKWEGVEGLITVVALLVDDKGNVIKSALIKSSGIPKADTIIQYGLIGEKYDMKEQLKTGQYKWLELAISFNEDTF